MDGKRCHKSPVKFTLLFSLVAAVLLLQFTATIGQEPTDYPILNGEAVKGIEVTNQRVFNGESLFGYMNGGAELYLEYGFNLLVVTEFTYKGNEYKLEEFKMNNPEAAFGIFSVSVFRCDNTNDFKDYSCQTKYQLQLCRSQYYFNIINNTGTEEEAAACEQFARALLLQATGDSFSASSYPLANDITEKPKKRVLFKGDLGLYNGAYDWYEMLKDFKDYTALLRDFDEESFLCLRFNDETERNRFLQSYGLDRNNKAEITTDEGFVIKKNGYDIIIKRIW